MLVIVRCVIFDGPGRLPIAGDATPRITHVREGQVLGAWRAADGRTGVALLNISSMATVSTLLRAAFPGARHVDIDEVLVVEAVSAALQSALRPDTGDSRQTGA